MANATDRVNLRSTFCLPYYTLLAYFARGFEGLYCLYCMQAWLIISSTTPSQVAQTCTVRKDVSRFDSFITGNLSRLLSAASRHPTVASVFYGRAAACRQLVRPPRARPARSVDVGLLVGGWQLLLIALRITPPARSGGYRASWRMNTNVGQ